MTTEKLWTKLLATTMLTASGTFSTAALAQNETPAQEPATQTAAEGSGETGGEIIITGTRIARPNLTANSPIVVQTGEQAVKNADITLDTFINTLPQVNPAGTTSSNNPGNSGQSNLDLRGLGSNRNLILIDGRRPMPSSVGQTVDLNTIPQGLIERIDIVTGGAGATYGADAIAGVANFILKDDFEGIEVEGSYSNALEHWDAEEYRVSGLIGANFSDGRGNVAFSFDYAKREALTKGQRPFSSQATSTTGTPPTGRFNNAAPSSATQNPGNPIPLSAINALFASYGVSADQFPSNPSQLHFNSDGTLFGGGVFNNPIDVSHFTDDPTAGANPNLNFYPDFYSYNFDIINLLVLPLERKSAFMRGNYEISDNFEVYTQAGWTEYQASTALAPTPVGVTIRPADSTSPATNARSSLLTPGKGCVTSSGNPTECSITGLLIPATNPFIPADLKTLLNARTGDDRRYVGSGATEPFNIAYRFLPTGLRQQNFDNEVLQGLIGLRGDIIEGWRYDIYYSYGRTTIDQAALGNVNVQKMQQLLEAPDGGASLCEGGFNPFGIHPLSAECVEFVNETGYLKTRFTQKIWSAYVNGDVVDLPAGAMKVVLGVEGRKFDYDFDPGALFGPIAGFNTQLPIQGKNDFFDYFGEAYFPILKDQEWARSLDLTIGYRHMHSQATDVLNDEKAEAANSSSYKAELSWEPTDNVRLRGSYQRAVRAPNFGELFAGGSSFPQIFDPCSVGTNFRTTSGQAGADLCAAQGVNPATFVALPGSQAPLGGAPNVDLKPEKADTWTVGGVFQWMGVTGSLDYYNIKVKDLIRIPDANMFIAACFGYLGNFNTALSPDSPYCSGIVRSGGNIAVLAVDPSLGGDSNSNFVAINFGTLQTSGLDLQLAYKLPTDWAAEESAINFNFLANYLISFKEQELEGVTIDYAGTAGYFGQGLSAGGGASHPRWKATLNTAWSIKPATLDLRIRYLSGMKNRATKQFPGEETFTGPGSVFYVDLSADVDLFDHLTLRVGVNNLFDKKPETYKPNVQSGTDPSLYDVVGRRVFFQGKVRF